MPTENCNNKNPLRLKGIAQEKRLPKALVPSFVKIDGKTEADYQGIAQGLSKLVQYYNTSNSRDGDWSIFFEDFEAGTTQPHIALFNAFIKLIKYAQDDLNRITKKHLEFYYQDVLKIAERLETPDEVHMLFELANNVDNHIIKAGTLLKGDKDALGNLRLYKTQEDYVVNRIVIDSLKSVFVQKDEANSMSLYAAQIANSSDGNGTELDEENPKWASFGKKQTGLTSNTMDLAKIGFAIASDFLLLKEGLRTLTLDIDFKSSHTIIDLTVADIEIQLSGEKKWISIAPKSIDYSVSDKLAIVVELSQDDAAVMAYNEELYGESLNTIKPVLKFLLNQVESRNVFGQLNHLEVESIELTANVIGAKDFIFQNENGTLDPVKPLSPFGSIPVIGSEFYLGSKEIFSKKISALSFDLEWMDLPEFNTYYQVYDPEVSKSDFTIDVFALKKRSFDGKLLNGADGLGLFDSSITLSNLTTYFDALEEVEEFSEFTNKLKNGFIKMVVKGPSKSNIKAFGHGQFQNLYVLKSIILAKPSPPADTFLPNEPYTPKIKSLSATYTASHKIVLNGPAIAGESMSHFFHIGPFGVAEQTYSTQSQVNVLPLFTDEGSFYIGFKNAVLPQNLSVLFQVSEGSANPNKLPSKIKWFYLIQNEWKPFGTDSIISDSSNGLINSGIMVINLPKELNNDNTWLPGENYWLKASIEKNSDSVCQLVAAHTQAVTAVFENNKNDLTHLEEALPAETISKLNESQSVIRGVGQPYASFGGKLPEKGNDYYRRVSERLRHKNRAITIWDFERIVLEEFPSIYKLKCLNHTRMTESYSEQAPGHVSLVVISNLRNKNAVNPLQPSTSISTLYAVKEFLDKIKNPFITLHTKNPDFEEIKVDFHVRLKENKDPGFYEKQLKDDIKVFLSPWAYKDGIDISFEGVIHKSKIINFIEELDYVDYLSCFKMYHIIDEDISDLKDVNEIEPSKSSALLVSSRDHKVNVLTTDDCTCDAGNITTEMTTDGIATMTVALDFIINKP